MLEKLKEIEIFIFVKTMLKIKKINVNIFLGLNRVKKKQLKNRKKQLIKHQAKNK